MNLFWGKDLSLCAVMPLGLSGALKGGLAVGSLSQLHGPLLARSFCFLCLSGRAPHPHHSGGDSEGVVSLPPPSSSPCTPCLGPSLLPEAPLHPPHAATSVLLPRLFSLSGLGHPLQGLSSDELTFCLKQNLPQTALLSS